MANVKISYAAATSMATTALVSLANGSGWQSDVIDNTTNLYDDYLFRVTRLAATTSGTGLVDFYAYAALSDTTYTDSATGAVGAFTAAGRLNSAYIGSVTMNTITAVVGAPFSVAAAFNGTMPSKWGVIAINNCGSALTALGAAVMLHQQGVSYTVT